MVSHPVFCGAIAGGFLQQWITAGDKQRKFCPLPYLYRHDYIDQ